mmetsp:Transcript_107020/g.301096  ORF Transcript_107020/g.301096 Transcript_107020/m.301096 type:complete len:110 (+) Transcript_107020:2237-2566(+)
MGRNEVVVIGTRGFGFRLLGLEWTCDVPVRDGEDTLVSIFPVDPGLQVIKPLVEEVDISEAVKMECKLYYCAQGHSVQVQLARRQAPLPQSHRSSSQYASRPLPGMAAP